MWIQSPYFMPDFAVLDALKIAARSGLDVRLMIPDKPSHLGGRLRDVYLDDLTLCTPFDRSKAFGNRYVGAVKEGVSRLVSPLL